MAAPLPPGSALPRCCYCNGRIHKQRNGEWYHNRNASVSCYPGDGSEQRATPAGSPAPAPRPLTECGHPRDAYDTPGDYRVNGHYHYANGACDLEPPYSQGGPA